MERLAGGGTLLYPITARPGQSQAYNNYTERNILFLLFFWICFFHSDPRLCRGRLLLRRVRLLLDLPFLNCLWIPLWFATGFCIHQFSSSIFLLTFFSICIDYQFNLYPPSAWLLSQQPQHEHLLAEWRIHLSAFDDRFHSVPSLQGQLSTIILSEWPVPSLTVPWISIQWRSEWENRYLGIRLYSCMFLFLSWDCLSLNWLRVFLSSRPTAFIPSLTFSFSILAFPPMRSFKYLLILSFRYI